MTGIDEHESGECQRDDYLDGQQYKRGIRTSPNPKVGEQHGVGQPQSTENPPRNPNSEERLNILVRPSAQHGEPGGGKDKIGADEEPAVDKPRRLAKCLHAPCVKSTGARVVPRELLKAKAQQEYTDETEDKRKYECLAGKRSHWS